MLLTAEQAADGGEKSTTSLTDPFHGGIVSDWMLLESQAAAGTNIDLIVKGTIDGQPHGLLFQPALNLYQPDSTNAPSLTHAQLAAKVLAGDTLPLMGVPPGSGQRMGIDRDLNGVLDADEPRPRLEVSQAGGKVLVSWPLGAAGFTLQQAGTLAAGAWTDNPNPVQIVGGSNLVTNASPAATLYFRLRK